MRTVVLPEGVPDVSACVLSLCLGAMKRRADAVGPATRQSARHQKMQATAGAAVREPAPQEDPEQLLGEFGRMQPPERPSTWFGAPPTAWISGRGPNRPPWQATPSATPSLVPLSALAFQAVFAAFRVLWP